MVNLDAVAAGAKVISTEINGLRLLESTMQDPASTFAQAFAEAVTLIENVKGRIVVSGMGKSGHVARKIAATLASTGAPATFVHPAEASHGDLGMITTDDAVIALSNSGETRELGDLIAYAERFRVPLIALTSGGESTLAKGGNVALVIPKAEEACAVTRAPTTSTTVMMAVGDALAVAVLQRKGFTAADFHNFHPGGKLGAALKRVTDLMHHKEMPLCAPENPLSDAVDIISKTGFGCVGVIDPVTGALIGIVTDGDLRRNFHRTLATAKVEEVMTRDPVVVGDDSLAAEALSLLSEQKVTAVFIVDKLRQPLGLLHVHDCLSAGVI